MRILFVCHRVPFPPKRGGKIRPFNMIRHLASLGHQVTVASLARTPAEQEEAAPLAGHCEKLLVEVIPDNRAWLQTIAWLPTTRPSSFGYFHSGALARRIRSELEQQRFDLIICHCSSVAPYVESVSGIPKMLDFGDMDSQKWREYAGHRPFPLSAGYWLEAVKLERRERSLSRAFDLCTCTTAAELSSLRSLGVRTPSDWFPNGVDADFFSPGDGQYDAETVCFVGRMDYFPNQQAVQGFCREVLPRIRKRRPSVRFLIVGADPPAQIRALGEIPGVTVTGSVPDVRPHVRGAAMTIAPLQIARGTQNKILESMALGVPVVSSRQASGGVDAVAGEHLLVADGPEEWADQVCGLLEDTLARNRLGAAARARVLSHHSWAASMARMTGLIERLVEERQTESLQQ
jgi:sugar transferase (PEP-CTERM/EpsH1 system associated)